MTRAGQPSLPTRTVDRFQRNHLLPVVGQKRLYPPGCVGDHPALSRHGQTSLPFPSPGSGRDLPVVEAVGASGVGAWLSPIRLRRRCIPINPGPSRLALFPLPSLLPINTSRDATRAGPPPPTTLPKASPLSSLLLPLPGPERTAARVRFPLRTQLKSSGLLSCLLLPFQRTALGFSRMNPLSLSHGFCILSNGREATLGGTVGVGADPPGLQLR